MKYSNIIDIKRAVEASEDKENDNAEPFVYDIKTNIDINELEKSFNKIVGRDGAETFYEFDQQYFDYFGSEIYEFKTNIDINELKKSLDELVCCRSKLFYEIFGKAVSLRVDGHIC